MEPSINVNELADCNQVLSGQVIQGQFLRKQFGERHQLFNIITRITASSLGIVHMLNVVILRIKDFVINLTENTSTLKRRT